MSGSSSEIKDEENGEENINNTEENVINNKNKIFYFSFANVSKYKKYTLYNNNNESLKTDNNNKIGRTKSNNPKIINIDIIDNELINHENIFKKINIYQKNNDNDDKKDLNKNQIVHRNAKNKYVSQNSSEVIFLRQKEQIKKMKEKNNLYKFNNSSLSLNERKNRFKDNKHIRNRQKNIDIDNIINSLNSIHNNNNIANQKYHSIIKQRKSFKDIYLFITLDNPEFFEISDILKTKNITNNFDEDVDDDEENDIEIIPIFNNIWRPIIQFKKINNAIEFSNIAVRTINEINYNTNGVEINIDLSLVGDSEFWIFSRCFVNKDINESDIFDTFSINNESDVIFNKYTSLIKIIKEKNSSKCFVSFGTFYEDENDENKIKYETFLKRQLVDFLQSDNVNTNNNNSVYYYLENDLLDIRVIIIDLGNEIIDARIFINNNQKCNHIEGKFYLPTIKRSKLLFCGIGQSIPVRKLRINNIEKFGDIENNEIKKSCTCCKIF